jgi:hypothetical protein
LPGFIDDSRYVSAPFDETVNNLGKKYNFALETITNHMLKRSALANTTEYNLNTLWESKPRPARPALKDQYMIKVLHLLLGIG